MAMFGMSDDMKAQLIQEIRKRSLIWKVSDPKYTDVPSRWLAFEEIAHELSDSYMTFSSDMIKIAWKNMMDYYNQLRRRHERALVAGTPFSKPKWQFYEMMHFVRQSKPAVKRKYNWIEVAKVYDLKSGVPASKLMDKDYKGVVIDQTPSEDIKSAYETAVKDGVCGNTTLGGSSRSAGAQNLKRSETAAAAARETTDLKSTPAKTIPRREGLRQSPKKSSWFVKKEYVTEDADEWIEPAKKVPKRTLVANPATKSVKSRLLYHRNQSRSSSDAKNVMPNKDLLISIDPNVAEPLTSIDSAFAYAPGREIAERLSALSATSYRNACREIESVVRRFEGLVDEPKSRNPNALH